MSQLQLGDVTLDSRRCAYIHSLKAVVCADLHNGLKIGISRGLRGLIETIDEVIHDYKPVVFILLGSINNSSTLASVSRRWGKKAKLQLVSNDISSDCRSLVEALRCEVYHELVWEKYRFVETANMGSIDLPLFTISSCAPYVIRVGKNYLGSMKLPVFLKGLGHLVIPSINPRARVESVFKDTLERYDVFALGRSKVFPLGKVADIKTYRATMGALPITKSALTGRLEQVRKKDYSAH